MPQASYPRMVWAWGFLVLSANLGTSELGLEVLLALIFLNSLVFWAISGFLQVLLSSFLAYQVPCCPFP